MQTVEITTPSPDEIADMFEELPRRVRVALMSNLHGLNSRQRIAFTDYPREVAEYIEASGLMSVEWGTDGHVRFRENEACQFIRQNLRQFLGMCGIEF